MSQIMYNYPAMLSHAADMSGYAGTMQARRRHLRRTGHAVQRLAG